MSSINKIIYRHSLCIPPYWLNKGGSMKAIWTGNEYGERPSKCPVYGLYKRIGFMRLRLICYFMDARNGRDTVRHMGEGYVFKSCKMPGRV